MLVICFNFKFLGVFQTLVEKHFPAPDRNRIQRLLGLDSSSNTKKTTNGHEEGQSSTNKRKPSESFLYFQKKLL